MKKPNKVTNLDMCKGCNQEEKYCSIRNAISKYVVKLKCPCEKCIVKIKCKEYCPEFRNYCSELYKISKDVTLLMLSETQNSKIIFSRRFKQ